MTLGALRIIEGDTFDICGRLKAIDRDYFVAYNVSCGRYEVHNGSQRGGSLALVIPYLSLDVRTVDLVLRTRSERRRQLIAEMEKENAEREKRAFSESVKKAESKLEKIFSAC